MSYWNQGWNDLDESDVNDRGEDSDFDHDDEMDDEYTPSPDDAEEEGECCKCDSDFCATCVLLRWVR